MNKEKVVVEFLNDKAIVYPFDNQENIITGTPIEIIGMKNLEKNYEVVGHLNDGKIILYNENDYEEDSYPEMEIDEDD